MREERKVKSYFVPSGITNHTSVQFDLLCNFLCCCAPLCSGRRGVAGADSAQAVEPGGAPPAGRGAPVQPVLILSSSIKPAGSQ